MVRTAVRRTGARACGRGRNSFFPCSISDMSRTLLEPAETLALIDDRVQVFVSGRPVLDAAQANGLGEHTDRGKRRLELVGDAGHKLRTDLRKIEVAADVPPEEIAPQASEDDDGDHGQDVEGRLSVGPGEADPSRPPVGAM